MNARSARLLWIVLLASAATLQAASTIYLATNLGPYKSTDGGETWTQLTVEPNNPFLPANYPPNVTGIALDPLNPSTVYLASQGFYKSSDAGQTWSAVLPVGFMLGQTTPGGTLAIDCAQTNVIYTIAYTSTNNGIIVKSTDAGVTFAPTTHVPTPSDFPSQGFPDGVSLASIAADPSISGVVYAVGADYVFKSADFAKTWSQIASQKTTGAAISQIFVNPRNSNNIYAISNPSNCGPPHGFVCGLLKTTNGGGSWAPVNLSANQVDSVAFDPSSGTVYAGAVVTGLGVTAVKSTDGGNSWTPLYNMFEGDDNQLIIEVDPNTPSTLYAYANSFRFWTSTDSGASWSGWKIPAGCAPYGEGCTSIPETRYFVVAPAAQTPPPPPAISANGVVNGASFQAGIVPGSWTTIAGTNLASKTDNWGNSIVNGQFPISLDGVSVEIGGKPAYIYFISPGQINLVTPDVGFGSLPVTVKTAGGESTTFTVTSSQYGPAFFEWPNNQPVATRQDFTLAAKAATFAGAATIPAKPGDVIILWGTGFGPTNPVAPDGSAVPGDATYSTTTLPTVTIDNVAVKVYGAALAPGFAGLYQVAIQVPASIANGDWPVVVEIGGVESPAGVLLTVHD